MIYKHTAVMSNIMRSTSKCNRKLIHKIKTQSQRTEKISQPLKTAFCFALKYNNHNKRTQLPLSLFFFKVRAILYALTVPQKHLQ